MKISVYTYLMLFKYLIVIYCYKTDLSELVSQYNPKRKYLRITGAEITGIQPNVLAEYFSGVEILVIENTKMFEIPTEINELTELRMLSFINNGVLRNLDNLKALDPKIQKNIEVLNLQGNNLGNIPDWIPNYFENLCSLNWSGNLVSTFPFHLARLSKLDTLILTNNWILHVDEEITNFQCLKKLDLSHNHISTISNTLLCKMKNLMILNLSYNFISRVRCFGATDSVKKLSLDISHNQMKEDDDETTFEIGIESLSTYKFKKIVC